MRRMLSILVLVVASTCLLSCGEGYYRDKNVDDVKESFGVSTQKAECFIDAMADATGFTYVKLWDVATENQDSDSYGDLDFSGKRVADAIIRVSVMCGINY